MRGRWMIRVMYLALLVVIALSGARAGWASAADGATTAGTAAGSGAGASSAAASSAEVKIDNFFFSPQEIRVKAGTTITWKNQDDIPHTVTSTAKVFKSQALDTDDNFSFTFTTPGVYQYFCSLRPHMTGTIVVEAKTGSN
jgi:plastocyanin